MKKRFLSILTAICFIIALLPNSVLAASPTIVVESKTTATPVGNTVTVNVKMSNNPGITALGVDISYDTSMLSLTKAATNGSVMPDNTFMASSSLSSPYRVLWEDGLSDYSGNGTLCSYTFKTLKEGTATISLKLYADGTFNSNLDYVTFTTTSGTVLIGSDVKDYYLTYNANGGTGAPEKAKNPTSISSVKPTKTYTVTYNPNGGSVSPTSKTYSATFKKWTTKADGSGNSYNPGQSYTDKSTFTLYAQWTNPTYGTLPTATRSGYTLDGWYTSASGGTKITSSTAVTASTTLYAHWSSSNTMTFSVGTASGAVGSTVVVPINVSNNPGIISAGVKIEYDKNYLQLTKFENTGLLGTDYIASGTMSSPYGIIWNDAVATSNYTKNGAVGKLTFKILKDNDSHKIPVTIKATSTDDFFNVNLKTVAVKFSSGSVTVANTHTIKFDANGGTGAPDPQIKVVGTALTLSSTKPTKSYTVTYNANGGSVSPASKKVSATFKNWNTKKDGTGTTYTPGQQITTNVDMTLYAQWTNPTMGTLPTPTRSGYVFDGWYTAASGGTKVTSSTTVSSNITIYTHWIQDGKKLTVTAGTATTSSKVGNKVKIPISISNNPGIIALSYSVSYDTKYLKLVAVDNTGLIGTDYLFGDKMASPYVMTWNDSMATKNYTSNGTIANLTFEVVTGPTTGQNPVEVPIKFIAGDVNDTLNYNNNSVPVTYTNGKVTIGPRLAGDVNNDGEVNQKDVTYLRRYLAKWSSNQNPNLSNSDVNGDNAVNQKDVTQLRRYLAKWSGYTLK